MFSLQTNGPQAHNRRSTPHPLIWLTALAISCTIGFILLLVLPLAATAASPIPVDSVPQAPPHRPLLACNPFYICVNNGSGLSNPCAEGDATCAPWRYSAVAGSNCGGSCSTNPNSYTCFYCFKPAPPPTRTPIPPTPVPTCQGHPFPSSGCVCYGTTLACSDGTCALFNPACMGGPAPTATRRPTATPTRTSTPTSGPSPTATATATATATLTSDDLSVAKAPSATTVQAGQNFTYTLTVTNPGPDNADNVTVTDTLPAELTYVSDDHSASVSGQTLNWNLGTLAPGVTHILITVSAANVGSNVVNSATVASTTPDPDLSNNATSAPPVTINTPQAGISIAKTVSSRTVLLGQNFTYTLSVTNGGPDNAENVSVVDTLPPQLTYVSDDHAATVSGQTLTWSLGTLAPGTVNIAVTVAANTTATNIINSATVASTTADPNPGDNAANAPPVTITDTPVSTARPSSGPAPLIAEDPVITKSGTPDHATIGETVTWRIRATNPSGQPTTAPVTFTDDVPATFDILSITINGAGSYTLSGQQVTFDLGILQPHATITVDVATRVNPNGKPGDICNIVTRPGLQPSPIVGCITLVPTSLPVTGFAPPSTLPTIGIILGTLALAGGGLWLLGNRRP